VAAGAVCYSRVLRHNREYLHGECWSLSNQEAAKLYLASRDVIHQCYDLLVSHLCDLVAAGAVAAHSFAPQQRIPHGECWSLSNQEAKQTLVIKG
jgi:hypothetical protein